MLYEQDSKLIHAFYCNMSAKTASACNSNHYAIKRSAEPRYPTRNTTTSMYLFHA